MNPLPPNADELVSAYLDGQAAPDEVVIVEASPKLMEQVAAMRAVSTEVAAPIPAPSEQKEAHLSAALSAFDALFADTGFTDTETAATSQDPVQPVQTSSPTESPVASLEAARERRRPRRFNIGVIAAAAAALLLIAGFTALSLGRGSSNDVASSASDGVDSSFQTATDSASDSATDAEDAAMEEAMDDDSVDAAEAMEDRSGGLSDAAGAAPANESSRLPSPTSAAANAASESAMDDEAMEDEEAADVQEDSAGDAAAADSQLFELSDSILEITPFYFGEFASIADLQAELTSFSSGDLQQRKTNIGEGIFVRCQSTIPELAASATPTLIGDVGIDDEPREIHLLMTSPEQSVFYVIDPQDCSVVDTFG